MTLETPWPYQEAGAQWLAGKDQALLADRMGLGKTCQAILAADMVGAKKILVVCPAIARVNWAREFEKFSPFDRPISVILSSKEKPHPTHVTVISYDLVVTLKDQLQGPWDLLILDEAHYLKERKAKRTKAIYGTNRIHTGIAGKSKRVWRLTGTPICNYADELWTHFHSAGLARESYWDWTFRYCSGFNDGFSYKISGNNNTEELKKRLEPFMLRRTLEDVDLQLPPISFATVTVPKSKVDLQTYFISGIMNSGGEENFLKELNRSDMMVREAFYNAEKVTAPMAAKLKILESLAAPGNNVAQLRRFVGLSKLPGMCEWVRDELREHPEYKIVVFAIHKDVIEGARLALREFKPVTLYGLTPPAKRQENIDKFQNDKKCRVFIANIQAAGTSITLTNSNHVVFFEQDWVPANNLQAAMRVHRIGQKKHVFVRFFSLAKSIDEQISDTLARKMRELAKIF